MKKIFIALLILTLVFPIVSPLNLTVNQENQDPFYLVGTNESIFFNVSIYNIGGSETINLYNLAGFEMYPMEKMSIASGETKFIDVELKPLKQIEVRGQYGVTYYIKSTDNEQQEEILSMNVIDLSDAIEIGFSDLDPSLNNFNIYLQNTDYSFEDLSVHFSSQFFDLEETFDLAPNELKEFEVSLNRENFKQIMAGFYTLRTNFEYKGIKAEVEKPIKFVEKDIIESNEEDSGIIIREKIITKDNLGNVVSTSHTTVKKNILSRLFTTFSPKPTSVDRQGWSIYYTWVGELEPGEQQQIIVKTNWLFPLLIILFIGVIVFFARQYSNSDLVLRKRAKFIRAKGGEFGIKISIIAHANKYVENITLTDRLPNLVKLYERFGNEQPTKIDTKKRKIEWNLGTLEQGEKRIVNYVVYSKLGIVGKFALPKAFAIFQRNGEIKETSSNRTFFIAEQDKVLDVYGN